jgi:hypothetical protein
MENEKLYADYEAACGAVRWITGPAMFNPEVFEFTAVNGTKMRLVMTGVRLNEEKVRLEPIAQLQHLDGNDQWVDCWTTDTMLVAMYMSVRSRIRR